MHRHRLVPFCLASIAPPLLGQAPAPGEPPAIAVGLNILAAAGTSTARDDVLKELQAGAHDPRKRGFTLQQAELGLAGDVDPHLTAKAYLIAALDPFDGETIVELEEAYLQSRGLPGGVELRAGTFFTEFGRSNATHPHAWDWQSQPVAWSRLFGGDGMRGPGARVAWSPSAGGPRLLFGAQNANGETMPSFLADDEVYAERGIGGRAFAARDVRSGGDLVWSLRGVTTIACGAHTELGIGLSVLRGPNATGDDATTTIWGADFELRGPAAHDGHDHANAGAGWSVQGEFVARAFEAAAQTDASDPLAVVALPGATLDDRGGYLQALHCLDARWAFGVRVEAASGSGASYRGGGRFDRAADPFRADRMRVSPLVVFRPSANARLRLQYDYDDSDHLGAAEHSVWLGFDVRLGGHGPHTR